MNTKPKSILVVDDDEDMLKLLNKIISSAGLAVRTASSPKLARTLMEEDPPHLILTDLHMVPENGFEFIQSLKNDRSYRAIPILVLSALNDFSSVKKAIGLGVSDYVIKPLQSGLLVRKIRKTLLHNDFLKWDVPANEEVHFSFEVEATVTNLGEKGYYLRGPFKLDSQEEIKISSLEFKAMDLLTLPQKVSSQMKTYDSHGQFLNEVLFQGMTDGSSTKIRQWIMKNL